MAGRGASRCLIFCHSGASVPVLAGRAASRQDTEREEYGLKPGDLEAIYQGNAERLFPRLTV
jgi:hypothetical protein